MTRRVLITILITGAATATGLAQSGPGEQVRMIVPREAQAGARVAVETRVTRNAPYSAEAVNEFVQLLGDGNRIVRRTVMRLYRDSDGRTRRETLSATGSPTGDPGSIVITDPVAGTSLILNPAERTAARAPAAFARVSGGTIVVPAAGDGIRVIAPSGDEKAKIEVRARATAGDAAGVGVTSAERAAQRREAETAMQAARAGEREDLGEQVIEGVRARGTRTTTTIAAGAIGNEQPITVVSEQWFSPELEVLVMTRHSDPRVGETTYRLSNIVRAEPDRGLFQAPGDYTIKEPVIMRRPPQR
jgi:hypothetical protein